MDKPLNVPDTETLDLQVADDIATVILSRPHARNAMNHQMMHELVDVMAWIKKQGSIAAIMVTGADNAFCAGGDVKGMAEKANRTPEEFKTSLERVAAVVRAWKTCDKPIVAAVNGVAYGAGFSFALLADFILVSRAARFSMAFSRVGLLPDMGALYTLPRIVGLQRAKEIILSGRVVTPEEAIRLGIALEIVPTNQLIGKAQTLARSLAAASPFAISLTKQTLEATWNSDLDTALKLEAYAQSLAANTSYHKTAVERFQRKEPAMFQWPNLSLESNEHA